VVGAGAWGTALALVAARGGADICLWAREAEVVESVHTRHVNAHYMDNLPLPGNIHATGDIAEVAHAEVILLAAPAQHMRATLKRLQRHLRESTPLVLCAKGIERDSGKLLTEVLNEEVPGCAPAILSGPSFARDVALDLPTAVTVAAKPGIAARLQSALGQGNFRPYASSDLIGVALGGAAKNVYAIGSGIVAGMGLGESARAGFLARGFAELSRLGDAMGAKRETLMGLSGLGDLILTATSPTSRNYAFGLALGAGESRRALMAADGPLAEGVHTAPALVQRARKHKIELPIADALAMVLAGRLTPKKAVPLLMARPLKQE
jgi:glycerol-3-phosphate dehydrogenase (NAD(P)+)